MSTGREVGEKPSGSSIRLAGVAFFNSSKELMVYLTHVSMSFQGVEGSLDSGHWRCPPVVVARDVNEVIYLWQTAYCSSLNKGFPHPTGNPQLLVHIRECIDMSRAILKGVLINFMDFVWPVEDRKSRGRDEVPCISREIRVPPDRF